MQTKIDLGRVGSWAGPASPASLLLACSISTFLQSTTHQETHFPEPDTSSVVFQFLQKKDNFCLAFTQPVETTAVIFPIKDSLLRGILGSLNPRREATCFKDAPCSPKWAKQLIPTLCLDSGLWEDAEHVFSSFSPYSWQNMKLLINTVS